MLEASEIGSIVCTITQKNNNTQHFPVVVVLLGKVWTYFSLKEGRIVITLPLGLTLTILQAQGICSASIVWTKESTIAFMRKSY
jgi:hypothetical protein